MNQARSHGGVCGGKASSDNYQAPIGFFKNIFLDIYFYLCDDKNDILFISLRYNYLNYNVIIYKELYTL